MLDATGRVLRARAWDRPRAFAVIADAVWRVTIVDATLVRYHTAAYDGILAGQPPAERRLIEETLAGLRFVRNRMGRYLDPFEFIQAEQGVVGSGDGGITAWTWKSLPEPTLGSLQPRAQEWEMTRYRAYQAQLAGRSVGEIFGRAAAFLKLTAAKATAAADASAHAAH